MSEKPIVVIDKYWYRKNRVKHGFVGTEKMLAAIKRKRPKNRQGVPCSPKALQHVIERYEQKDQNVRLIEMERARDAQFKQSDRQAAYSRFLMTPQWRSFRRSILEQRGNKCEVCGDGSYLQVHHTRYPEHWMDTTPRDVMVVCRPCHERAHKIFRGERRLGPSEQPGGRTHAVTSSEAHSDPAHQKHPHRGRDGQQARPRDWEDGDVDQPLPRQGHQA